MNFILSIFLCLAMIFGNTYTLPAQPETATTWTLSNVTLDVGGERVTLAPEARLTFAAGEQRSALHFEIGDGESVYLPVSLEVTPEALLLSITNSGRAFRLSNEELLKLAEIDDPEDLREIDLASEVLVRYGALIGTILIDPAATEDFLAAFGEYVLRTYAGPSRRVEVEIDGQTYPAAETELHLSLALLDDLRSCGVPAVEDFLELLLQIINETGTPCTSFSDLARSGASGDLPVARVMLTMAEADGLSYIELRLPEDDARGFEFFGAITRRGDSITVDLRESIANADFLSVVESSSQITGSLFRPETGHVDAHQTLYRTLEGDSVEAVSDVTITEDYAFDANRLCSGTVTLQSDDPLDPGIALPSAGEVPALNLGQMTVTFRQSAGANGGVTTSVEIAETRTQRVALSFDLNMSVGPAEDYFGDTEVYEVTAEELESGEMSPLTTAGMAEGSQFSLDALQLAQEPSVQAMMELIQSSAAGLAPDANGQGLGDSAGGQAGNHLGAGMGSSANAGDSAGADAAASAGESAAASAGESAAASAGSDAAASAGADAAASAGESAAASAGADAAASAGSGGVQSFEDAAAIYAGELAGFTPPEGYAVQYAMTSSEEIYLSYAAPGMPNFVLYAGPDAISNVEQEPFLFADGALTPVDGTSVTVYYTKSGNVDFAYVLPPEGDVMNISFYPCGSLDDLASILAGIH